MIVFVDTNHRCHPTDGDGRNPYDLQFFDGKAPLVTECYEYYPQDGKNAERIKAVMPTSFIDAIQHQYNDDCKNMADMQTALEILGVTE